MTPLTTLRKAHAAFAAKAMAVTDDGALQGHTFEELLELRAELEDVIRKTVTPLVDLVNARLIETTPNRFEPYPLAGGGVLKFGGGREKTSYDQRAIVSAAAAQITEGMTGRYQAVVTTEGEPTEIAPVVEEVAVVMAELTGALAPSFTGWRSGVAKRLGLDPGDYAEKSETPVTVRVEGR